MDVGESEEGPVEEGSSVEVVGNKVEGTSVASWGLMLGE